MILLCILLFQIGCKETSQKTKNLVNLWIGKKIILPDKNLMRRIEKGSPNLLYKKLKIITFIDGDCSVCVDELQEWKKLLKKIDTAKVGFVCLINSNDKLITFERLDSLEIHLEHPYFYDERDSLRIKNAIPDDKLFQTFLVNEQNEVLLLGNPTRHKKMEALYLKEIKKTVQCKTKTEHLRY